MWWYLVVAWLLAVGTEVSKGGVPPAPLHVGGYQRRLVYEQPPQGGGRQEQLAGAAAALEMFRDVGPMASDDWGPETKRDGGVSPQVLASQHMLRSPRGSRQYDVPQIGKRYTHYKHYTRYFHLYIGTV